MYIFQSSFLKQTNTGGYRNIDITNQKLGYILNSYTDGYITLTHSQLRGTFYLTIENLRKAEVPFYFDQTFLNWLNIIYNLELPVIKEEPKYKTGTVLYSDAFKAGFSVNCIARNMEPNDNVPRSDQIDLFIDKSMPQKNKLFNSVLTTVSGFLHRNTPHSTGLAILGGGKTFMNTQLNTVGVLSFANCCRVQQLSIEEDMIEAYDITSPLIKRCLIKTNQPIINKKVLLSLGGYFIHDAEVIKLINPEAGLVLINTEKLDFLKLILGSVGQIDLDSLGIFSDDRIVNYNKVRVEDVQSDNTIKRYLTLEQSFLILLECDDISFDYIPTVTTGLPSVYEYHKEPTYPLISSLNKLPEYWKYQEEESWVIKTTDDITKRYIYKTNIDVDNVFVNSMSATFDWYHDKPYLLKMTTVKKI